MTDSKDNKFHIEDLREAFAHITDAYAILDDYFSDIPGTEYDKQIASDILKRLRIVKNHIREMIAEYDKYGKF